MADGSRPIPCNVRFERTYSVKKGGTAAKSRPFGGDRFFFCFWETLTFLRKGEIPACSRGEISLREVKSHLRWGEIFLRKVKEALLRNAIQIWLLLEEKLAALAD